MGEVAQVKRSWEDLKWDVSASKLRLYSMCPRRFAFRYVLKLKGPEGSFTGVGSAVHSVLEHVGRRRLNVVQPAPASKEELLEALAQLGVPNPGDTEAAGECLAALAPFTFKGTVVGVEQDFQVDLGGGEYAGGFMDLVTSELQGRLVRVTDYKTGFVMPSQAEAHLDPQIRMYLVAARELYPQATTIVVELLQVPSGNRVIAEWSPLLDTFTRIHMRGARTHWNTHPGPRDDSKEEKKRFARDYPAVLNGTHCKHCPYTESCHEHKNWLQSSLPVANSQEQHANLAWHVEALDELKSREKAIAAEKERKAEKVLVAMQGKKSMKVSSLHYAYKLTMVQGSMTNYPPSTLLELSELEGFSLEDLVRDCVSVSTKKLEAAAGDDPHAMKLLEELKRKGSKKAYVKITKEQP